MMKVQDQEAELKLFSTLYAIFFFLDEMMK